MDPGSGQSGGGASKGGEQGGRAGGGGRPQPVKKQRKARARATCDLSPQCVRVRNRAGPYLFL